jgi:type VI secretion system secreted protein VgrG
VKTKHDVGQLGGCKAADSPELLQKKADAWKAQAIARNTLDVTCFGGGNDGHQQASAAAWEQWGKCKGMGAH